MRIFQICEITCQVCTYYYSDAVSQGNNNLPAMARLSFVVCEGKWKQDKDLNMIASRTILRKIIKIKIKIRKHLIRKILSVI